MLFILTGGIQTGKTRWLQATIDLLEREGIACYGVLAPGVWREGAKRSDGEPEREKLGIDNELLPDHERFSFAKRQDLAKRDGTYDGAAQAARAGLGWHISDEALAAVNAHFASVRESIGAVDGRGLLVVDELGQLELLHGEGLTEAVASLEEGPTGGVRHALVIARDTLADLVEERFANVWGGACRIAPDAAARELLLGAVLRG